MPPREQQTLTIASPFKFGFYAGIGFFVASAFMSCLGVLFVILIGFGSVIGFGSLNRWNNRAPSQPNAVQSAYSVPAQSNADR